MLWPQRISELTHRRRGLCAVMSLLVAVWTAVAPALPSGSLPALPAPAATAAQGAQPGGGAPTATRAGEVPAREVTVAPEPPRVMTATPWPTDTSNRPHLIRQNLSIAGDLVLESALAWDDDSITIIEETRVAPVRVDEVTGEPHPGMATGWDVSPDGRTYTFYLREDVPWVKWNAIARRVEKAKDCNGDDRMVTAKDFQFGILHAIAYREDSPGYAYVLAQAIQGGSDYYFGTISDSNRVAVRAVDDWTLQITFETAGVFNASIAGMWLAMATPAWLVDGDGCNPALGDRWAEPTNLQTYGPFAVADWIKTVSLSLVPNPYWPGDAWTPRPQVDKVAFDMLDMERALESFEAGTLDSVAVPATQLPRVRGDARLSALLVAQPIPCSFSFAFNTQAQYVDDARIRRALSMAVDRQAVVDRLTVGMFEPAQWFVPPSVWGAPTLPGYLGAGIDFRPDEARQLLDEYLDEKGMTRSRLKIAITVSQSTFTLDIAAALQEQWAAELGLQVRVDIIDDATEYSALTRGPDAPQIWRAAWCADYPDAEDFVPETFAPGMLFNATNPDGGLHWQNEVVDTLTEMASTASDAQSRAGVFAQIEHFLVYEDAAIIPIFWYTNATVTQPWVQRTFSSIRHERYEKWSVGP